MYVRELLKYQGKENLLKEFNEWEIPRFPVNGNILKENGVKSPKLYSFILTNLKDIWIENEYKQTTEDLVKLIPTVLEQLEKENK